jgi:hypothetical protein
MTTIHRIAHQHYRDTVELHHAHFDLSVGASVVTKAIDTPAAMRTTYWLGDSAVHLYALASVIAQAEQILPDAVRQARDQDT